MGCPARQGPRKSELLDTKVGEGTRQKQSQENERVTQTALVPSQLSWGYFLLHIIPPLIPHIPLHNPHCQEWSGTHSYQVGELPTLFPLALDRLARSSPHPGGQRLLSVSPASLSRGQQPPRAPLRP